jgi:hypothetical protein
VASDDDNPNDRTEEESKARERLALFLEDPIAVINETLRGYDEYKATLRALIQQIKYFIAQNKVDRKKHAKKEEAELAVQRKFEQAMLKLQQEEERIRKEKQHDLELYQKTGTPIPQRLKPVQVNYKVFNPFQRKNKFKLDFAQKRTSVKALMADEVMPKQKTKTSAMGISVPTSPISGPIDLLS